MFSKLSFCCKKQTRLHIQSIKIEKKNKGKEKSKKSEKKNGKKECKDKRKLSISKPLLPYVELNKQMGYELDNEFTKLLYINPYFNYDYYMEGKYRFHEKNKNTTFTYYKYYEKIFYSEFYSLYEIIKNCNTIITKFQNELFKHVDKTDDEKLRYSISTEIKFKLREIIISLINFYIHIRNIVNIHQITIYYKRDDFRLDSKFGFYYFANNFVNYLTEFKTIDFRFNYLDITKSNIITVKTFKNNKKTDIFKFDFVYNLINLFSINPIKDKSPCIIESHKLICANVVISYDNHIFDILNVYYLSYKDIKMDN